MLMHPEDAVLSVALHVPGILCAAHSPCFAGLEGEQGQGSPVLLKLHFGHRSQ